MKSFNDSFRLSLIVLATFITSSVFAQNQVRITLHQPPPNQLSAGDLWKMTLENTTGSPIEIYLEGYGEEEKEGRIVDGTSPVFTLPAGRTNYNYENFKSGNVSWKNRKYEEFIVRTGQVPAGSYTTCVTAYSSEGILVGMEKCITQIISRGFEGEITLIAPGDGENIDPSTPITFAWAPLPGGGPYKIKIVEIIGDQSPEVAMNRNKPFFEKEDIRTTMFQYPSSAPNFIDDRDYAWIIEAGDLQSEVRDFRVGSKTISDEFDQVREDLRLMKTPESEIEAIISRMKMEKPNYKLPFIIRSSNRTANQPCANGGFEMGDFSSWDGGTWGTNSGGLPIGTGLNLSNTGYVTATYTGSLQSDPYWGRHVILPDGSWETNSGFDPILAQLTVPYNLPVIPPGGGNNSLRLGNPYRMRGAESISQTFLVTSQSFSFSYAIVLQESHSNPGGAMNGSESFLLVRILDMNGNEIYRLEEVGNPSNPFVSSGLLPGSIFNFNNQNFSIPQRVFYRDWSCVNLTLPADVIGQNVTIEFITADCNASGHWGYAYIDNVCEGCAGSGNNNGFNGINSISGNCVPLQVCGSFQPPVLNGVSGVLQNINLQLYQNGLLVTTYGPFTPTIDAINQTYCFNLSPSNFLPPPNLDGFDVVTIANFSLNNGTVPVSSGSLSGFVAGPNNDFFVNCSNPCDSLKAEQVQNPLGDCCWNINLTHPSNTTGIIGIQFLAQSPNTFVSGSSQLGTSAGSGWLYPVNNMQEFIVKKLTGNIPTGQLNGFVNFCLNKLSSPQYVIVNWLNSENNIVCSDTVTMNCDIPCVTIIDQTLLCSSDGYDLSYTFTNTASFPIGKIEVVNSIPSGMNVNTPTLTLSTPVNPGQISNLISNSINGIIPDTSICLILKFTSPDGCCWCYDTLCVSVPSCICNEVEASITGDSLNCCFNLSLQNTYSNSYFNQVRIRTLDAGVVFSSWSTNTSNNYYTTNTFPDNEIDLIFNPSAFPNNYFPISGNPAFVLNYCLNGYTASTQSIVVEWMKNDSVKCADTLITNCIPPTPPTLCVQIINDTLICLPDGTFQYNFAIKNNSTHQTTGFQFNPISPSALTFTPANFSNVSIAPGMVSAMQTMIISGISSGSQFCFNISLYEHLYLNGQQYYDWCCYSDTICKVAPCSQPCQIDLLSQTINGCYKLTPTVYVYGITMYITNSGPPVSSSSITSSFGAITGLPALIPTGTNMPVTFSLTTSGPGVTCIRYDGAACTDSLCFDLGPCNPPPPCDCRIWKEKKVKVSIDNVENIIECNGKIENVIPSNNISISFADYLCIPANCNATYDWTITGPIPQSGTTNTITNADFSLPGTYEVTMTPKCGGKDCDPCKITIVVKGETPCNCGYMWFPGKYQISGGTTQYVSVGQTINLPVPSTINFDFNGAFGCNPPGSNCPPNYNWVITGPGVNINQSSTNPVFTQNFPQPNSIYNVSMSATCGTEKCSGPKFTVKTGGTINCECGSWTGGIRVDGNGIGCNQSFNFKFNKGYRSIQGPTMSCNPNVQNCSPQYSYVVKLNGITVHSGSGNSFSNFYFQSNKYYTIIFNANCGSIVCQPCQTTIRIKGSIFGGLGNVSFGNIGIKNPNVGPSIFNPSGSVRPDFSWNSSISPGKQGNLTVIEVTPGMSTGDLSELVKELQEKEPLFEVSVISDRTSYPKEAPDLSSGKYYIWVVYEAGESDGEATILNAGFFKAGLTAEGKEIINCDDCEKMCPGGRCWNINGKCYCF